VGKSENVLGGLMGCRDIAHNRVIIALRDEAGWELAAVSRA